MKKHKRGGKNEKPYRGMFRGGDKNWDNVLRECQRMQESRFHRYDSAMRDAGYDGAED